MKIEREKMIEPKEFKPVTLTITIESKEELFNLYHRIWVDDRFVRQEIEKSPITYNYFYDFFDTGDLCGELFQIIKEKDRSGELSE